MKPIGITMGDANGVGPEIVLNAFKKNELPKEVLVIGDYSVLEYCNRRLKLKVPLCRIQSPEQIQPHFLNIYDQGLLTPDDLKIGRISKVVGSASLAYVRRATQMCLDQQLRALATLPVNKAAIQLSEPDFSGHTGCLADWCGISNYSMMLVSQALIVSHLSTHVSLRKAIELVKKKKILEVIQLTHEALLKLRRQQRIAVAGLNPHAGEDGAFGDEELEEIFPAIEAARERGFEISGPFPPDTIFREANIKFDAIVAMYHDQGHIPAKLIDFKGAINVTLGLNITRTSVDHGTAYDIAYQNIAWTESLRDAVKLAIRLSDGN